MANKVPESSSPAAHGETPPVPTPQPGQPEHQSSSTENTVTKSGPLLIASKGIGWTSWKKRWFVLGSNSLVFYRSDPSATAQKNPETNLPLGGIDLNNSGSVDVKPDKKLLNVLFPDGRDGRTFTLKAETLEDLLEWKNVLETAIAQAPSATAVTGENGILNGEQAESAAKGSSEQQKEKPPVKSTVIGRPVLLALQDIDGSPSFLEKALKFIEKHGVRTEGILRQAADVEEVERRVYEYEHGKTEFSPDEDAHVIADCVKHILRELPSAPVPASCCNALLEAFRADRSIRVHAMRTAILETFPEPNRKLLQRCLLMMQVVASHKAVNRMGTSAVAACMAPLLLRPLLAGDCEVENQHMDVAGDNSFQLLQAAAAANHAQAIIITLLDEYDQFFGEGSLSHDLFSEEEESGSEDGTEYEDDDEMYEEEDDEYESEELDEDEESGSEGLEEDEESGSDEEEGDTEDDLAQLGSKNHRESGHNENHHSAGQKEKQNISTESLDLSCKEQDEIKRLEATKKHLEIQVAEEAKSNKVLQTSLEGRRRVLDERRLALEIDVDRLQEQLQNEREIRAALDAGLSISQIPISASVDEKVKAQLMEIAAEEANISSLKQRVDDLGVLLYQQCEENYSIMRDRGIHPPEPPPQERNKSKGNESGITSRTIEKSPKSKGKSNNNSNDADRGIERTPELPSTSKKYSSKTEGSSTSALSKLTTRLNFLKERRTQIANELQNLDKGRESGQSPLKGKQQQSEVSHSTDKKQENNESPPQQKSDIKIPTEANSTHPDSTHKGSAEDSDKGKGSEGQSGQNLDKVKLIESKPSRKRSSKTTK